MASDSANEPTGPTALVAGDLLPCSAAQLRFYFLQKLAPNDTSLNVAMRWRISGRLSDLSIERALTALVARHEILRTAFVEVDGAPRQAVVEPFDVKLLTVNLSRLESSVAMAKMEAFSAEDALNAFDLAKAPLFRATMLRLDPQDAYLHLTFHHLIIDGWSIGMLMRELLTLATAYDEGRELELPPVELQYGDYALWQEELLGGEALDETRAYWRAKLAGLPRFEAPGDRPRPKARTSRSFIRTRLVPKETGAELEAFSAERNETLFTTASACLAAMLAARAGQDEVVLGTQVAGRNDAALETVVGPFLNSLVLRLPRIAGGTFATYLSGAGATVREALANQDLPFENLVEMLNPPRDPSRTPVYGINFTLQPANIDTGSLDSFRRGDLTVTHLPSKPAGALWDLGFFMVGREEGWRISCEANADMYDEALVDAMLAQWETAMARAARSDDRTLVAELTAAEAVGAPVATPVAPAPNLATATVAEPIGDDGVEEIVQQLLPLWRDVLKNPEIGRDSEFFQSGGHSLLAMRLVSRIKKETGFNVDLPGFFENPRPVALAQLIASRRAPIVTKARTDGEPMSIVALNNGVFFAALARSIDPGRAFHHVSVDFLGEHPQASMSELARLVADKVRELQIAGPYVVLGYCVNGNLAFETARDLKASGDPVRMVALINSTAKDFGADLSFLGRLKWRAAKLTTSVKNFGVLWRMFRRNEIDIGIFLEHYGFLRDLGVAKKLAKWGWIDPMPESYEQYLGFDVTDTLANAHASLTPGRFEGDAILFKTDDVLSGRWIDPTRGWGKLVAGRIEIVNIRGTHSEIGRDPSASDIAVGLERILADGSARRASE